jgi:hypothetical protein
VAPSKILTQTKQRKQTTRVGNEGRWEYLRRFMGVTLPKEGRKAKKVILDEFCENTGYDRKYAIRLLSGQPPEKRLRHRIHWLLQGLQHLRLVLLFHFPHQFHESRGSRAISQNKTSPYVQWNLPLSYLIPAHPGNGSAKDAVQSSDPCFTGDGIGSSP